MSAWRPSGENIGRQRWRGIYNRQRLVMDTSKCFSQPSALKRQVTGQSFDWAKRNKNVRSGQKCYYDIGNRCSVSGWDSRVCQSHNPTPPFIHAVVQPELTAAARWTKVRQTCINFDVNLFKCWGTMTLALIQTTSNWMYWIWLGGHCCLLRTTTSSSSQVRLMIFYKSLLIVLLPVCSRSTLTLQDRTKVTTNDYIGSCIRPFDWCQNQRPWMTLNDRYTHSVAEKMRLSEPTGKIWMKTHTVSGKKM